MTPEDFEAAIRADPEARDAYVVYADWLQQQGDPRGELMAVQLARELDPVDAVLAAREAELFAAHEDTWLGGARALGAWLMPSSMELGWRRGFVDTLSVRSGYQSDDAGYMYDHLAPLPVTRCLRELALGVECSYGGSSFDPPHDDLIEVIAAHPAPSLRRLRLSCFDHQLSWTHVGALAPANAALAALEHLEIIAGNIVLGELELPRLVSMRLETGGLRPHVPASLARTPWPRLAELVVYFGTETYGGSCTVADTAPLLDGAMLPAVEHLGLCNAEFGDELAAIVPTSRILPRLRHLDLSQGTMGPDGAAALLASAPAFAHLASLDLSNNFIPEELHPRLAQLCPRVELGRQKRDVGYGRFVSVGE